MSEAILYQVLEQIKTLDPDELQQVGEALQDRLSSREAVRKRRAFHQALLASGLVKQIKQPAPADGSQRRLLEVQGKPVSEAIIEERR